MKNRLRTKRVGWAALLATSLLLVGAPAVAQGPSDQERSAARALAQEADALWEQADYAGALDRFNRAHSLVGAPSLAIRQAECLAKLGRLVEASETYEAVSRTKLDDGAPDAYRTAVATANERAVAIRKRLPKLTVVLQGDDLEGVEVTMDGKAIPRAVWGAPWPVDPGTHRVVVTRGGFRFEQEETLKEAEARTISLSLPARQAEPAPAPASPPPPPPPPPAPGAVATAPADDGGSSHTTWAAVSFGVGAGALVFGGIMTAVLAGKRSDLDRDCETETSCPASVQDDVDSYNSLRPLPTVGFVAGGVAVGAGIYFLLSAPDSEPTAQAGVRPWVGLGSAGVEGRF